MCIKNTGRIGKPTQYMDYHHLKIRAVHYAADLMAKSEHEIKYRNIKNVINAIN